MLMIGLRTNLGVDYLKLKSQIDEELFQDLIDTMETASLCALGGGLPLPIKNALVYFKEELSPYFTK